MRLYNDEIKHFLRGQFDDLNFIVPETEKFDLIAVGFASYCAGDFTKSVESQFDEYFRYSNGELLSVEVMLSKTEYEMTIT